MNYTNEIYQIITAIKDGAQSLTPIGTEFVRQYQNREAFDGLANFVLAIIAAFVTYFAWRRAVTNEDNDELYAAGRYVAAVLAALLLWVFVTCSLTYFGHCIAPIPSLLGK